MKRLNDVTCVAKKAYNKANDFAKKFTIIMLIVMVVTSIYMVARGFEVHKEGFDFLWNHSSQVITWYGNELYRF